MTHATLTAYLHHRCRCEACRERWAQYKREYRKRGGDRKPEQVPRAPKPERKFLS